MVQTRSAAKRQQEEEVQRLAAAPKPLVRESTVIEITVSDTGLGTHIRWLRPPQHQDEIPEILSSDLGLDPRFVTPAPESPPASLRTPPRLGRQRRIGNPGIFNSGTTVRFNLFRDEVEHIVESARVHGRDLLTEFELYSQEEGLPSDSRYDATPTDTFGNILEYQTLALRSPFPSTHVEGLTPLGLGPHGTHLVSPNNFGPTYNQWNDPTLRLGPHGTHINISQEHSGFIYHGGLPTGRVQGLGPSGTVIIGSDGRPIVPGIRPGYY